MTKSDFYISAKAFLSDLFTQLDESHVRIESHWDIDHICYRTSDSSEYVAIKTAFSHFAHLLAETEVNGRPIATFQLFEPIVYSTHQIFLLEVPAPKPGRTFPSGFEHVEIVCDLPMDELINLYQHLKIDTNGLKKVFNQELEIELRGCAVKFHHLSLHSVVTLETNTRVFKAIHDLKILETLRAYSPLIAGTFPLGVSTTTSDVDILIESKEITTTAKLIENNYGRLPKFQMKTATAQGQTSLIANFEFNSVPFEIFAQNIPSVRQQAYRHFQVEERLLKLGGEKFRNHIMALRNRGLKTEPAFAEAIGLTGDPFAELLTLHTMANSELTHRISRVFST